MTDAISAHSDVVEMNVTSGAVRATHTHTHTHTHS